VPAVYLDEKSYCRLCTTEAAIQRNLALVTGNVPSALWLTCVGAAADAPSRPLGNPEDRRCCRDRTVNAYYLSHVHFIGDKPRLPSLIRNRSPIRQPGGFRKAKSARCCSTANRSTGSRTVCPSNRGPRLRRGAYFRPPTHEEPRRPAPLSLDSRCNCEGSRRAHSGA
jgi:hypothetical protein